MGRQLAVTDRTDLSFYDGWDGCYVEYQPATYLQLRALIRTDFDNISEEDAERGILNLVKERTVGGKVRIQGADGSPEVVDLENSDLESMPAEMINRIYADMTGVAYDADPLEETQQDDTSSENASTEPDTGDTRSNEPTGSTSHTETE